LDESPNHRRVRSLDLDSPLSAGARGAALGSEPALSFEAASKIKQSTSEVTGALLSIQKQLSNLLVQTGSPTQPGSTVTSPCGAFVEDQPGSNHYVDMLERKVGELEQQISSMMLEKSVSHADRAFMSSLINEKDKTIQEWGEMIQEVEDRQLQLEAENARLRNLLVKNGIAVDEALS
jgi:hypothetical protein